MNSKFILGSGLVFVGIITAFMVLSNENDDSLSAEEINELEKQQSAFPARATFTGGDMMFLENWCSDNKGLWQEMGLDMGECLFETRTQYHLASAILDELQLPTITGKPAQEICRFLNLQCPQRASFDGYFDIDSGKTFVNYEYKGVFYNFDVSDEEKITFRVDNSKESFNLSENATLFDDFSIRVKTGYDYYTIGEKIGVEGLVRDNHRLLSESVFEYPVILQITRDGVLIEVAQLDIRHDGQFQYVINTDGFVWKPGQYQIRTAYDTFTAITVFDLDAESR